MWPMWFLVSGEDSSTGNVMGGRKLARYVLEAGAFRAFQRPSDRARGRRDHLEAAQGNSGEHLRLRRHSSHRCCPKSLPSRLEHIEGTEHGGRLYRQERSRSKRPLASTTIASPSCRQVGDGFDHLGKTISEVGAVAGVEPHARCVAARQDAEAVVLDLVNPAGTGRRLFRRFRQKGLGRSSIAANFSTAWSCWKKACGISTSAR